MLSKKQEIIDVFQMIKNNDYEKMLPLINEVININDLDILFRMESDLLFNSNYFWLHDENFDSFQSEKNKDFFKIKDLKNFMFKERGLDISNVSLLINVEQFYLQNCKSISSDFLKKIESMYKNNTITVYYLNNFISTMFQNMNLNKIDYENILKNDFFYDIFIYGFKKTEYDDKDKVEFPFIPIENKHNLINENALDVFFDEISNYDFYFDNNKSGYYSKLKEALFLYIINAKSSNIYSNLENFNMFNFVLNHTMIIDKINNIDNINVKNKLNKLSKKNSNLLDSEFYESINLYNSNDVCYLTNTYMKNNYMKGNCIEKIPLELMEFEVSKKTIFKYYRNTYNYLKNEFNGNFDDIKFNESFFNDILKNNLNFFEKESNTNISSFINSLTMFTYNKYEKYVYNVDYSNVNYDILNININYDELNKTSKNMNFLFEIIKNSLEKCLEYMFYSSFQLPNDVTIFPEELFNNEINKDIGLSSIDSKSQKEKEMFYEFKNFFMKNMYKIIIEIEFETVKNYINRENLDFLKIKENITKIINENYLNNINNDKNTAFLDSLNKTYFPTSKIIGNKKKLHL